MSETLRFTKKHTSIWSKDIALKESKSIEVVPEYPAINVHNIHKSLQSSTNVRENGNNLKETCCELENL